MIYLRLFWEFFQIGLFSIGGGAATIPFLEKLTTTTDWFTIDELLNMIAVSESTPGAIGINMSTFAGFEAAGPLGGIVATFGLVLPSVLVIMLVSLFLKSFKQSKIVQYVFYGLRAASCALIFAAVIKLAKTTMLNLGVLETQYQFLDIFNFKTISLGIIVFLVMQKLKVHPIFYIAGCAVIGIIFNF